MASRHWRTGLLAVVAGIALAGCLPAVQSVPSHGAASSPPPAEPLPVPPAEPLPVPPAEPLPPPSSEPPPAAPAPASGIATLSWAPPTLYTNGSVLPSSEIEVYRIYHGTSAAALTSMAEVDSRTTSFTALELTAGTHFFAVTAVTVNGTESGYSEVGSKTVM